MVKEKDKDISENREIVYVDINNVLEVAKKKIMEKHRGVSYSDIEYIGDIDKLKFTIPKKDRKGKCDAILPPGEEGGCGETGRSCICGKDEGHEGDHECKLCGEKW